MPMVEFYDKNGVRCKPMAKEFVWECWYGKIPRGKHILCKITNFDDISLSNFRKLKWKKIDKKDLWDFSMIKEK